MSKLVTIRGIEDVNRILREIAPNEAKNLMRATTADMAKQLAKDAKAMAPKDQGDVAKGIKSKRARGTKTTVRAEVVANANKTSFYWRFLEYGQGPDGVEHAFFLRAMQKMKPELSTIYLETFVRKLEARLARLAKRGG